MPTVKLLASTHARYRIQLQCDAAVLRPLAKLPCSIDAGELGSVELGSQAEICQELGRAVLIVIVTEYSGSMALGL